MDFYSSKHAGRKVYDEDGGQEIYEYIFQPTFKEAASLNRSVFFSSYLIWAGKVRELALDDIGQQLVEQIATGEWGLVTNWADLNVVGEIYSFETVLAKFRIGKIVGSIIPLRCEFFKITEGEEPKPLAVVEQETTWVAVIGHGRVRPAPFPAYLADYLQRTRQRHELTATIFNKQSPFVKTELGEKLYKAPSQIGGLPIITDDIFLTTLEDANLVGNVYYANYFIWQGRLRDKLFYELAPEFLRGIGSEGRVECLHSRLDYLRDAMPFDKIYVSLAIDELYQSYAVLKFEYYRLLTNDSKEKLAVGKQSIAWVKSADHLQVSPSSFPRKVIDGILEYLSAKKTKLSA